MLKQNLTILLIMLMMPARVNGQDTKEPAGDSEQTKGRQSTTATESTSIPDNIPSLKVDTPHVDLGVVREGGAYDFSFELENVGTAPLTIERVRSSCGCTVTKMDNQTIPPGESVTLNAKFNSKGRIGKQKKFISVYSNDPRNKTMRLSFEATVEALYQLRPSRFVSFGNKRREDQLDRPLRLLAGKKEVGLEILEVRFSQPGLTYTTSPIEEKGIKGHRFDFALAADIAFGLFTTQAMIKIKTAGEEVEVGFAIRGRVISQITVGPPRLFSMVPVLPGQPVPLGRISLRAVDPQKPFHILHVDAGDDLTYEIEEVNPELEYHINFSVSMNAKPGPTGRTITIISDSSEQPVITVPAYISIGSPVVFRPEAAYLRREPGNESQTSQTVILYYTGDLGFNIEGVRSDNPSFIVARNDTSTAQGAVGQITVSLAKQTPPGKHRGTITVYTNVEGAKKTTFQVFGEVVSKGQSGS